ncbi:MAG: cold-shock protein [Planctomycetes bacterium]|nr:cold-shock protein [Planctomycetota bacterium]
MAVGMVKWFDPNKGFGFVVNEEGTDVFVHYTSIEGQGFRCLKSGQKVTYEEIGSDKGLQGKNVFPLPDENDSCDAADKQEMESSQLDAN